MKKYIEKSEEQLENLKKLSNYESCEACGKVFKPEYKETICPDCQDEHEEALDEQVLSDIYRERGSEWIINKLKEADKGDIFDELI